MQAHLEKLEAEGRLPDGIPDSACRPDTLRLSDQ